MERFNLRYIARIVVETTTPIAVGSGEKTIMTDAQVIKDVNGLPYIPATSVAGVLRHAMKVDSDDKNAVEWGFHEKDKGGQGSRIIFTNANLVNEDGRVVDGLLDEKKQTKFLKRFEILPIRQHARIGHKGHTEKGGKFDEEVVYKGTRFCFEIEMLSKNEKDKEFFKNLLNIIHSKNLRMGGGTRSGFGELKVIKCKWCVLNLEKDKELNDYIAKSSSLEDESFWAERINFEFSKLNSNKYKDIVLKLRPRDFFLFGSGMGDDDVDMTPVNESYIIWNDDNMGFFTNNNILIPGSSLKGAIAHRVAYHYNKLTGNFADKLSPEKMKALVGNNNTAVRILFGSEGDNKGEGKAIGNVFFSDLIEKKGKDKILNHVAIDRFTGGAIDGALFSEKVSYEPDRVFMLTIIVDEENVNNVVKAEDGVDKDLIYEALNETIKDLRSGLLPLGGGVNRGNGVFEDSISQNDLKV